MVGIPGGGGGSGSSGYGWEGGFSSGAGVGLGRVSGRGSGFGAGISGDWGDGLSGVTIFYISKSNLMPGPACLSDGIVKENQWFARPIRWGSSSSVEERESESEFKPPPFLPDGIYRLS